MGTEQEQVLQRPFGSTGKEVGIIGQGTWYIERSDQGKVVSALRLGVDLGMNLVDTAELYGRGRAEEIVGKALRDRRDETFVVSKVLPQNASRRGMIRACQGSLARLGTDRLDCYLLHWRGEYPIEETVAGFHELLDKELILSWGVSNFDVPDMEEAWDAAGDGGKFVCNQVLYHLRERSIEHSVLPWCERHGVVVMAYSPFGHGDFPGPESREGRVLKEIADSHQATPRQVALAFLTRRFNVFAIPKASSTEHVVENAGASALHLSPDELALIDESFPLGARPSSLPTL